VGLAEGDAEGLVDEAERSFVEIAERLLDGVQVSMNTSRAKPWWRMVPLTMRQRLSSEGRAGFFWVMAMGNVPRDCTKLQSQAHRGAGNRP